MINPNFGNFLSTTFGSAQDRPEGDEFLGRNVSGFA
jgi:hypothetical protein